MGDIIEFSLSKEQLETIKELENNEEYMDLQLVSGLEIIGCPGCQSSGCFGSCQMHGC